VLSFAGRFTLSKFVVVSLPTYTMQTVILPKQVCAKLEFMNRKFFWAVWRIKGNVILSHGVSYVFQRREEVWAFMIFTSLTVL